MLHKRGSSFTRRLALEPLGDRVVLSAETAVGAADLANWVPDVERAEGESAATVTRTENQVLVIGTAMDNTIDLLLGAQRHRLTVDGMQFEYGADEVDEFLLSGSLGNDIVRVTGTAGDDLAELSGRSGELIGAGYAVSAEDFEEIRFSGGSGNDQAILRDSPGDDRFVSKTGFSMMVGDGYLNQAQGFSVVEAFASAGMDRAELYDAQGVADRFEANPEFAYLKFGEGDFPQAGFVNYARGFDQVDACALDVSDMARLSGSTGDDQFVGTPEYSSLEGAGYRLRAEGFGKVEALAGTGDDRATLNDSSGNDRYEGQAGYSFIQGDAYLNDVRGFDRVDVTATDGFDIVLYRDLAETDLLFGREATLIVQGAGREQHADGFDRADVYARQGERADVDILDVTLELNLIGDFELVTPGAA
jgi:hypothetical protein